MRAERAVGKPLEASDMKPQSAASVARGRDSVAQPLPGREWDGSINPGAQATGALSALECLEVIPRSHVVHRRDALLSHEAHRGDEGGVFLGLERIGDRAVDERLRVVLEDAGQLAALIAYDLAAFDSTCVSSDAR